MKNNRKLKSKFKIATIVLVLVIVVLTIVILLLRNNSGERVEPYTRPETIKPMFAESFFLEYDGNISEDDLLNYLTDFTYYIVDNKEKINNFTESNMKSEYLSNEEKFNTMGFATVEDYIEILTVIQKIDENNLDVSYTSFDVDSIEKDSESTSVIFSIKFTTVDKILFDLQINEDMISISYLE